MSPRLRRWALLVGWVIALLAVAVYSTHTLKLSTDLRSFMPPPQTPDQKLLMEQIGEGPGSRLLLLALSGAGEEPLAELSRQFSTALREDAHFSQVVNGEFNAGQITGNNSGVVPDLVLQSNYWIDKTQLAQMRAPPPR